MWVCEDKKADGGVLFQRPLYHDELESSDRRFELKKGKDDELIQIVQQELQRICYLATLPSPYPVLDDAHNGDNQDEGDAKRAKLMVPGMDPLTSRERQHRRNRRRFFGM
jgi:hypothetical protein